MTMVISELLTSVYYCRHDDEARVTLKIVLLIVVSDQKPLLYVALEGMDEKFFCSFEFLGFLSWLR